MRGTGAPLDRGSALVEFLGFGVLALVPLIYLVAAVARVQTATLAAGAAAAAAARAAGIASDQSAAQRDGRQAAAVVLADYGIAAQAGHLSIACEPAGACPQPGGRVRAQVDLVVVLPGVPAGLDQVVPLRVRVSDSVSSPVDPFRSGPPVR